MAARALTLTQQWAALAIQTADAITTRNQQRSSLLPLPGEIGNKIYAYHFDNLVIDICEPTSGPRKYSTCTYDGSGKYLSNYDANACGLIQICRQLNADCHSLLFQYATLRIEYPDGLSHFLNDLSTAQLDVIRMIHIANVCTGGSNNDNLIVFDRAEYNRDRSRFVLSVRAISCLYGS